MLFDLVTKNSWISPALDNHFLMVSMYPGEDRGSQGQGIFGQGQGQGIFGRKEFELHPAIIVNQSSLRFTN
jgi:hypothetical protein